MDTQLIQSHLARISAIHGSPITLPIYEEESFQHLTEEVTFRRYNLDLIKANDNQFFSRPVVEELWALACRVLANVAFPESVGVEAGMPIGEKETALFGAFAQVSCTVEGRGCIWKLC